MDAELLGLRLRELRELDECDDNGLDFGDLCADILAPEVE